MSPAAQTKYGAVLLGAASLGAQTLLLRSALTAFYGNELLIGGILALWLFWVGIGSGPVFSLLKKNASFKFVFYLLLVALLFCGVGIVLFRLARIILAVPYGEYIPFFQTILFVAAVTAPPCLSFGVSFALLAASDSTKQGEPEALVYAWETAAAAVCGIFLSLATPIASNLLLWTILFTAAVLGTAWFLKSRLLFFAGLLLALIAVTGGTGRLDKAAGRIYWRSFAQQITFFAGRPTLFGETSIVDFAGEKWIYKNGGKVAPIDNDLTAQPLAAAIVCAHPQPRRVLVIEGFLTGLPKALLAFDSLYVTALEFDRASVEWLRSYADSTFQRALDHPRLSLIYQDALRYLKKNKERFDIIVLNVGAPTTAAAGRFFSAKFLSASREHLEENGILVIPRIPAGENYLGEEAALFHRTLFRRLQPLFPQLTLLPGDEAVYLLGRHAPITFSIDSLAERYENLGPHQTFFHPTMFSVVYDSLRSVSLLRRIRDLSERGLNLDLAAEYLVDFILWHKTTTGKSYVEPILNLSFRRFSLLFLFALFLVSVFGFCLGRKGGGFILIAGLVGFAVMAMNLALMLAFQVQFGYIYAWLAVLNATFMLGMAAAAAFVNQKSGHFAVGAVLERLLVSMIFLSLVLLPALEWIGEHFSLFGTLLLFLIAGGAGGAAFAVLCARFRCITGTSDFGGLYAADVLGGGIAALLLSGITIPLFGLTKSLYCAVFVLIGALALAVVQKH
ncbi:MAG: hypothetical protein ONB12_10245 [candidate division KSB1 bacterium]|nr:hypothetical protein [candidate division KSB1 bacterium]